MSAEPLQLSARLAPGTAAATGNVTIKIGDDLIPITVTVPVEPTTIEPLLPIFQGFLAAMSDRAVGQAEAAGRRVSCKAGCGACCRQGVPIAPSEARDIAAHVAAMPPERQAHVRARFAAAKQALADAGISDGVTSFNEATIDARLEFGMAYFKAGVACPFLEDENCSIHPVRPLACREYLVTSPAENCRWPTMDNVAPVRLGGSLSQALIATEAVMDGHGRVLLVDALDWAAANPAYEPVHTGPSLVKAVFDVLAKLSDG